MAKNITIGFLYRGREERLWQGNRFSVFVPASRKGKTYMIQLEMIQLWINISEPLNGMTKLFKVNIGIEI